ncbi:Os01g0187300 [Oryza sativa Japonica Group]|uniref:Os01g0187300 protein n=2 Tax=Oryza sativa TaxID=4530 RepID=A0A0N7KCH0_ORYSJ|nr:hypothetical protein OsI_00704 [Oryza sativa Indica Group]KAB8080287.1 hypothetical protein EE612_000723 [Oryza sativa]BAS70793.1 Os01g0187300 [Oryza sativa Japonica Group]
MVRSTCVRREAPRSSGQFRKIFLLLSFIWASSFWGNLCLSQHLSYAWASSSSA